MSMQFSRNAIMVLWLVVLGLSALFLSPMTFTTGLLLLLGGVVVPGMAFFVWTERSPTVAQMLHDVEAAGHK